MRFTRVIGLYAVVVLLLCPPGFSAGAGIADAAKNRDLQTVRSLLKQRVDVNARQLDGATAIHWAVQWDDLEMTELLISAGADVEVSNRNGATPMMLAGLNGNAAMVKKLLDAGANANGNMLLNGETPLMMAARSGSLEAARSLLDHGANVSAKESLRGTNALMWAAQQNRADVVKLLIERGADPNEKSKIVEGPPQRGSTAPSLSGGATALIIAVRDRAKEAVQVLLDAGADPNLTAADGTSAMLTATINRDYDLAAVVLKNGGNPNITNDLGWFPLYMAVKGRYSEVGALPIPDESELPAVDLIQMLLESGADPNLRMTSGSVLRNDLNPRWLREPGATAFLRAAASGDLPVMRLLLAYGADPKITTLDKTNSLMTASGVGYTQGVTQGTSESVTLQAVELLLNLGLPVNAANNLGITALHGAAHKGANSVVQLLVDRGADLAAKGKVPYQGQAFDAYPLDFAMGVSVNAFSPFAHSDTAGLLEKLMTAKGIPIPTSSRYRALDNNFRVEEAKRPSPATQK